MRLRSFTLLSTALVGLGLVVTPAAAQAAGNPAQKPRHCVADISTSTAKVSCYDSFPVAIAKATGNRVADAPTDPQKAKNDSGFTAKINAAAGSSFAPAATVIEIAYEDSDFGGSTWTWTGAGGCESNTLGNVIYSVNNWDDFSHWWNDEMGSFRNYSLCFSKHYEHAGFQGAALGWDYPERSGLGSLDDEISSMQWS
jgi:hypothetical protein